LNSRERNRSAETASLRRKSRYTSETNKKCPPPDRDREERLYGSSLRAGTPKAVAPTGLRTPQAQKVRTGARRELGGSAWTDGVSAGRRHASRCDDEAKGCHNSVSQSRNRNRVTLGPRSSRSPA
jgi:hypothetical protein